ncbi:uncharacterized protein [Halyomorpha halys]|uniref:uncharacterized protein isoform X1 n=1 Tax=Halyomorpha halys TaxID=286706 RepID=UPI0006D51943|nr:uncharacterized protein LOC106690548 isoform X2 [Halyomorpha halys]
MEAGGEEKLSSLENVHSATSTQMTMTIFKGSRKVSSAGPMVHRSSREHRPIHRFLRKMSFSRVFRSLRSKKPKPAGEDSPRILRRESFYLSTVSLEKRRPSEQSIDTIITLLDENCSLDNRVNEKIEQMTLIEGLV